METVPYRDRAFVTSFIAGSSVILFFFLFPLPFCWNFDAIDGEKAIRSVILNAVPANCYTLLTHKISLIGPIISVNTSNHLSLEMARFFFFYYERD